MYIKLRYHKDEDDNTWYGAEDDESHPFLRFLRNKHPEVIQELIDLTEDTDSKDILIKMERKYPPITYKLE